MRKKTIRTVVIIMIASLVILTLASGLSVLF